MNTNKLNINEIKRGGIANLIESAPGPEIKKSGRPLKNKDEKLSEKVTVNFTKVEYQSLERISKEEYFNIPLATLIRGFLQKEGFIPNLWL